MQKLKRKSSFRPSLFLRQKPGAERGICFYEIMFYTELFYFALRRRELILFLLALFNTCMYKGTYINNKKSKMIDIEQEEP